VESGRITAELELTLTGGEVATLIEASHDALYKRLQWTVREGSNWRDLDILYAGQMVTDLVQAHTKLYLAFRELGHLHDEFEKAFMITDDVYELIDTITDANSWDQVPTHRHAESLCQLCRKIGRVP
jgi:hypothetical protein